MLWLDDTTGYKIGAAGQRRQCICRLQARDNSNMWTLGKRNAENALNVVAKKYEGQVLIYIRPLVQSHRGGSVVSYKKRDNLEFGRVG